MPRSLREHHRDQFLRLEQGFMIVLKYKTQFYELARHASSILLIKYEQIRCFIRGLRLPLCMAI